MCEATADNLERRPVRFISRCNFRSEGFLWDNRSNSCRYPCESFVGQMIVRQPGMVIVGKTSRVERHALQELRRIPSHPDKNGELGRGRSERGFPFQEVLGFDGDFFSIGLLPALFSADNLRWGMVSGLRPINRERSHPPKGMMACNDHSHLPFFPVSDSLHPHRAIDNRSEGTDRSHLRNGDIQLFMTLCTFRS